MPYGLREIVSCRTEGKLRLKFLGLHGLPFPINALKTLAASLAESFSLKLIMK